MLARARGERFRSRRGGSLGGEGNGGSGLRNALREPRRVVEEEFGRSHEHTDPVGKVHGSWREWLVLTASELLGQGEHDLEAWLWQRRASSLLCEALDECEQLFGLEALAYAKPLHHCAKAQQVSRDDVQEGLQQ